MLESDQVCRLRSKRLEGLAATGRRRGRPDGVDVSFKVRLDEGMSDVSNDTISAVYPEYYSEVYPEMTALQMRIADFRAKKDVQRSTFDDLDG